MKLTLNPLTIEAAIDLALPNDLLWVDEFNWNPTVQTRTYSLTGALIIETGTKQAGRPITLSATSDMAWVSRTTMALLKSWAAMQSRTFTLTFQYPTDTRTFTVVFDQSVESPVEGKPVKDFPGHSSDDWFAVKLKLIEV